MRLAADRPGWDRLWRHSYRLGWRWLLSGRWRSWRVGLARLLVPLDPWRYYELGKAADEHFDGLNLDISSPKLLTSLLRHEDRGDWVGIDLFRQEIESWRRIDPSLRLEVQDATRLPYPDATFDHCISISVVEHIAEEGDTAAMAEMWRVLKPGGILILTTNVCAERRELWREDRIWGEASRSVDGRVFFERHYTPEDLSRRLLAARPWEILHREYAMEIDRSIHDNFVARMPWSVLYGALFRRRCPSNFRVSAGPEILTPERHGVVYLKLGKTTGEPIDEAGREEGSSRGPAGRRAR